MKKIYTLMIALLMAGVVSAQWIPQETDPHSDFFNDIFFVDNDHGWVVGDLYSFRTMDGGNDWELMPLVVNSRVFFTDQDHGWVVGSEAQIMNTSDGGMLWHFQESGISTEYKFISVYFIDPLKGWILGVDLEYYGDDYMILNTSNGGDDWIEQKSGSCSQFKTMYDIKFFNGNIGWAIGDRLEKTYDGGVSWESQEMEITGRSLCIIDQNNLWLAGSTFLSDTGSIMKSSNGGETWSPKVGDTIPILNDITFFDENFGWAVGNSGTILHTSNGGENWEYQESGTLADLHSIFFIDQNNGWICGDSGVILHTNNGGIVGFEDPKKETVDLKIYPNPSSLTITLELGTPLASNISLNIYNLNGQQLIAQPITKPQTEIDISHLPVGIYIVKVWNDQEVMVQQVIKQ